MLSRTYPQVSGLSLNFGRLRSAITQVVPIIIVVAGAPARFRIGDGLVAIVLKLFGQRNIRLLGHRQPSKQAVHAFLRCGRNHNQWLAIKVCVLVIEGHVEPARLDAAVVLAFPFWKNFPRLGIV